MCSPNWSTRCGSARWARSPMHCSRSAGSTAAACKDGDSRMVELQLNHMNIPARDPEGLVRWYVEHLGLRAEGNKARGPGVLLVFQAGEPVNRAPELHLGFQVPDNRKLAE